MKHKAWIKSPWTISISTAIFSLLLTMLYDYSKSNPILTTITIFFKKIEIFILLILSFEVRIWWLLIVIIVLIFIFYQASKFTNKDAFKPDFYNYKQDRFKHWNWSWNWQWSRVRNAWGISNLKAHCPKCDTPLIDNSNMYGYSFECPRCDFKARDNECDEPHKIEQIIFDNIERERKKINPQ